MVLAGTGDVLAAVALGKHNHRTAVLLELVHIRVHTSGRGGAHGTASHALGSLGRTGIVDGMVLHVLRHALAGVQTSLQLGVRYVATHDDGAVQTEACAYGVLGQYLADVGHGLVEVDPHHVALAGIAQLGGYQFIRLVVHLLNPDALLVDLALDIAVGRAAYAQTYGAAGTVTGQTHHADIVGHVLAAELCTQANLVGLLQELLLQLHIAEGTARLVARGRQ